MAWDRTPLAERLGIRYPIVGAPMSGSTTPALVAAVSEAGGLGSLGSARSSPDEMRAEIAEVRRLTDRPFAVNLFAPLRPGELDPAAVEAVTAAAAPHRRALGLDEDPPPPTPREPSFTFDDQLTVVVEERVPVFSFTFGIPTGLDRVREAGATVMGTATTIREAQALERAGVDAVVAQGYEAGGHRGTFEADPDRSLVGLMALVPQAVAAVSVPVVAAGAIMNGAGIVAALALGAQAAQLGTAFLGCPESAAPEPHKRALAITPDDGTLVTRALTGRHARAIRTPLAADLHALGDAVAPFETQRQLVGDVYAEARRRGDGDRLAMLTGQASSLARGLPAGELMAALVAEAGAAAAALADDPA